MAKAVPDLAGLARLRLDLDTPTAAYDVDTANNLGVVRIIGLIDSKKVAYLYYELIAPPG